jgi:hypothetical protein
MPFSEACIETASADRYAGQLSKHFAHKIPVTDVDAGGARIAFPFGAALVRAEAGLLLLRAEADDEAALERVRSVISDHLARFAFREALDIVWQPAGASSPKADTDAPEAFAPHPSAIPGGVPALPPSANHTSAENHDV